jgi:Family of unknown function (DUF6428)
MKLSEFSNIVSAHPDKLMHFVLPSGKSIPFHYHITEVGHVKKDFIDCGGTLRSVSACVLQAWIAVNDENHRLNAGKLATILQMAGEVLPDGEIPIELEYEAPIISQFTIESSKVADDAIVFQLANKHTDCLAKESCGLEGGCCSTEEGDCYGSKISESSKEKNCC